MSSLCKWEAEPGPAPPLLLPGLPSLTRSEKWQVPGLESRLASLAGGAVARTGQPSAPRPASLPQKGKERYPRTAQGNPNPAPGPGAHRPHQAVLITWVDPAQVAHLAERGFPFQPGKAQVGRVRGEGGRSLRGFQPGNKTKRTNPASKYMITQRTGGCSAPLPQGHPTGQAD